MENRKEAIRKKRSNTKEYAWQRIAVGNEHMPDEEATALFQALDEDGEGSIRVQQLFAALEEQGLSKSDPRLQGLLPLSFQEKKGETQRLRLEDFIELLKDEKADLVRRAFRKELVIPHFDEFRKEIEKIYEQTRGIQGGAADDTVPQPGSGNPPAYAVSICTVDGQLLQLGDHQLSFSIQSICKPVNYAIALEELGEEALHKYVGVEPGGENFDVGMVLNEDDLPHNPLINSGAIMTSSLIKPELEMEQRLEQVMEVWARLSGGKGPSYKEEAFVAERKSAHKNLALAHLMKERGAFPENTDVEEAINFYLKCCAIEMSIDDLAQVAATLANFGVSPVSEERVLKHDTVKNTLSLMLSSGMYDHSGEFAFRVGMPAKSGIAGGMIIAVPNLLGISVYSPPLDSHGNSVRGVKFCEELVSRFNFHLFDALGSPTHGKKDPRRQSFKRHH